jgi:hypothetical protein
MRIRCRVSLLLGLAFAAVLLPGMAGAQPRRLVTDPEVLARLGFPASTRSVFLAEGVDLDRTSQSLAPEEFGTADEGWTTVLGNGHDSRGDGIYDSSNGTGDIYAVSGDEFYDAALQMPQGALWEGIRWWGVEAL